MKRDIHILGPLRELPPEAQERVRQRAREMGMDADKIEANAGKITTPPSGKLGADYQALQRSIGELRKK